MGLLKVLGIGKYLKKVKDYTDQQIANLVGSAPETLDTLQELSTALKDNADIVDTLNGAITKKADKTTVEDSLKNINTSISDIKNDLPFSNGDAENSAVLKGGNNQVISDFGVALGKNNLVGLKGFYYKYITLKAGGNTKIANVYLSKTQVSNPTIDTNSGSSYKDESIKPQKYWAVGDTISIVNDAKYDDIATVKQIKDGLIQIEWLDGKSPFSTVKQESDLSSEDYSIYCLSKPTQGISDLGKYSFAKGSDNKSINVYTEVSGKGNVAKGKFAKLWGKDNVGGYNTTTFGTNNTNLADNSFVNGTNNINEGNNSVIHGNNNKNYGKRAFVTGNENITNNENEAAFGKYNNSENDTQFSIGIGASDTDRKNAFEVKQNGDIYIEGVEGRIQDKINKLVNITYSELVDLRDSSKLIPGQQYRITDYTTTTIQENTQSAGHQFDVIVIADDVNVLNENARAIQHKEDTYFTNSDLNTWKLKYCLDNDTDRFAWADATNGKGVIYYMKDEWNNECPYDFKNIQFARWELSIPKGYINNYDIENSKDNWIQKSTSFDSLKTGFYGIDVSDNVFYYGYNNKYKKYKVEYNISKSPTYCYTFGIVIDFSIDGSNYGNVIKEYKNSNKIQLNNNVFLGSSCKNNSFGDRCYSNTIGALCSNNTFVYKCYSNTIGNFCYYNSFGTDCHSNSFGEYCNYNSLISKCSNNTFANSCDNNSLGNQCYYNSFGSVCYSNIFGNNCEYNIFGNQCYSNSFGNDCYRNSFGNYCVSNNFGNYCEYNTFGESNTNPKSYYCYIIFDNGNRYINLNCTSTTSSSKYYQNVRIGLGVNNTTTYKTINDRQYLSDECKVFIHKETKDIMGWGICLGNNDSINNYDEVECPEEYKGNKDYDNTVKEEENL